MDRNYLTIRSTPGDPVCPKHGKGCLFHGPVCLRGWGGVGAEGGGGGGGGGGSDLS